MSSPTPDGTVVFIIYDGRAAVSTDDAIVYSCADTLEEARRDVRSMFPDGLIFSYVIRGGIATDEKGPL